MEHFISRVKKTLCLVAMMFVFLAITSRAQAAEEDRCTNASLRGSFGFKITGTNLQFGQFAFVGRFAADGAGNVTGTGTENVGGVLLTNTPFIGTFTVNTDCTGNTTLTFANGIETHLAFVLVDEGNEILIIDADNGVIETGSAKKQFPTRKRRDED